MIIRSTSKKVTLSDISEFEAAWNIRLPESYINFLLQYNGGTPEPNNFLITDWDLEGMVDTFYGLHEGVYGLNYNNRVFKDRIPDHCITIGTDPGGNQICLSLGESNYGYIYFWDHEEECDEGEHADYSNIGLISKSFHDLLSSLY